MGAARRWAAALCLAGLALGLPGLPAQAVEGGAQLVPAEAGGGPAPAPRRAVGGGAGGGAAVDHVGRGRARPGCRRGGKEGGEDPPL